MNKTNLEQLRANITKIGHHISMSLTTSICSTDMLNYFYVMGCVVETREGLPGLWQVPWSLTATRQHFPWVLMRETAKIKLHFIFINSTALMWQKCDIKDLDYNQAILTIKQNQFLKLKFLKIYLIMKQHGQILCHTVNVCTQWYHFQILF